LCQQPTHFAGATLHLALTALGATDIDTYFVPKGENIHTKEATEALSVFNAAALVVLDQGSRGALPSCLGYPPLFWIIISPLSSLMRQRSISAPASDQHYHMKASQKCTELPSYAFVCISYLSQPINDDLQGLSHLVLIGILPCTLLVACQGIKDIQTCCSCLPLPANYC